MKKRPSWRGVLILNSLLYILRVGTLMNAENADFLFISKNRIFSKKRGNVPKV